VADDDGAPPDSGRGGAYAPVSSLRWAGDDDDDGSLG
jgi:hypothetical protein